MFYIWSLEKLIIRTAVENIKSKTPLKHKFL